MSERKKYGATAMRRCEDCAEYVGQWEIADCALGSTCKADRRRYNHGVVERGLAGNCGSGGKLWKRAKGEATR
jgi:hypothetical protein